MKNRWMRPALLALLATAASCGEAVEEGEVVARVDGYTLSVDQVVDLLVDEEGLAADVSVVRTLADFWIDYTLLAAAVDRDTTFADLDLEPLVQQQLSQSMVFQLRDSVIQVDTFITPEELEELYQTEDPGVELRASHIMLTYPVQATQAQRDSVRALLEEVRSQIASGASFEAFARQLSQDPASAPAGGDLGFFRRGEMVAPFEEAALALDPGELSDVVETPMGLHLIRLEDRRTRDFARSAAEFRVQVQARRIQQAESTFVSAIEERVEPTLVENAAEVTREVARTPSAGLSGRAARRPLVEWDGGAVTVGELQTLLRLESAGLRNALSNEEDERVETFLRDLARRELLIEEARRAGLQPGAERVDSLVADAEGQLRQAARILGFLDIEQAPGEPRELAIARAVEEALIDNLTGATQFVPLGLVSFQLRDRASFGVDEVGVGRAIVRIGQVRANRTLAPAEGAPDAAQRPDTVAR